ncbi:DUF4332 domain-containing protein [Chloroflexota bacterium]
MNNEAFRLYLKRGGRSASAADRCVAKVAEFERFLIADRNGASLDDASPGELVTFVAEIERVPRASAKTHLWAIRYYYRFSSNAEMARIAGALRQDRINRRSFALKQFRGVNQDAVQILAEAGLSDVRQMLKAGRTEEDRAELAIQTGLPEGAVLEFVKLSDLARIPGVKAVRARLYYDSGVDTVENIAQWQPEELRAMLVDWIDRTGFEGIAPLPKEAEFTVNTARELPRLIQYGPL